VSSERGISDRDEAWSKDGAVSRERSAHMGTWLALDVITAVISFQIN